MERNQFDPPKKGHKEAYFGGLWGQITIDTEDYLNRKSRKIKKEEYF